MAVIRRVLRIPPQPSGTASSGVCEDGSWSSRLEPSPGTWSSGFSPEHRDGVDRLAAILVYTVAMQVFFATVSSGCVSCGQNSVAKSVRWEIKITVLPAQARKPSRSSRPSLWINKNRREVSKLRREEERSRRDLAMSRRDLCVKRRDVCWHRDGSRQLRDGVLLRRRG